MIPVLRAKLLLALLLLAPLAGCIELPDERTEAGSTETGSDAPAPSARIDGMTAEATHEDTVGACEGNGIQVPPKQYCGTRVALIEGRIGETEIPVELVSTNGRITIQGVGGDAWSLVATVRSEAMTEEGAREALEGGWTWTHEKDGRHGLWASSTPQPTALLGEGRVSGITFELQIPDWVVLDLDATTTNGAVAARGIKATEVMLSTSNGGIDYDGTASALDARTSNGAIDARVLTTGSGDGAIRLQTSNGGIDLALSESATRGYDLDARTTNGKVAIALQDGRLTTDEKSHKHFTTNDYAERDIRRVVELVTSNGGIDVES